MCEAHYGTLERLERFESPRSDLCRPTGVDLSRELDVAILSEIDLQGLTAFALNFPMGDRI